MKWTTQTKPISKQSKTSLFRESIRFIYTVGFSIFSSIQILYGQKAEVYQDENYPKYNLKPNTVEKWEDGLRTNPKKREFEWWYFDGKINDGTTDEATIVVAFYTKSFLSTQRGAHPFITVNITRPKKEPFERIITLGNKDFSATKGNKCNVNIGNNYFRDEGDHYSIHIDDKGKKDQGLLTLDIDLWPKTPGWRPKTGHTIFKKGKREKYFAWVVAVPHGKTEVNNLSFSQRGETISIKGRGEGYHDHNWGNRGIPKLYNHWYWARSSFKDSIAEETITVIGASMIPTKKYGGHKQEQVVFNVFKGDKSLSNDRAKTQVKGDSICLDNESGKDIKRHLTFLSSQEQSPNGSTEFEYSLMAKKLIAKTDMLEVILSRDHSKPKKNLAYRIVKFFTGFDAHYYRFAGESNLRIKKNENMEDSVKSNKAIWELMYLGKPLTEKPKKPCGLCKN